MIEWMRTVWVLHQRFRCNNPNCTGGIGEEGKKTKTIASIDPRAMSQLPTEVAERFEFMSSRSGPGIHISMAYAFAFLCNYSVLFGTFASLVNEFHSICTAFNSAATTALLYAGTQNR
jgi:hypothetical protein